MKRFCAFLTILSICSIHLIPAFSQDQIRRISVEEYKSKMKAGWIGQMAGVGWGGPTEFHWKGEIIPEDEMPEWKPETVNQFNQDDIYVEMTFLHTLEVYGLHASIRQAGIDFANSGYRLWHANRAGRDNLRNGIAPPDSGHPKFNKHADDIDYQIEADYAGLISPGLPNVAIGLGETFGRLMNYGDGLYGGQFVAGMYAEAFFENDMEKIVEAGLRCIPAQSQYAEAIRDTLKWYHENPDDWETTWKLINEKYHLNRDYRKFTCAAPGDPFNIDAKINGAYIVMGLLYGKGDPDRTIVIATRCGQDSDCNPSNAGGILFTTMGFNNIPERFISALDEGTKFSHTTYDFASLIQVCETLARQAVLDAGGNVETDSDENEIFVIPVQEPRPSAYEPCWSPGPIANSHFTDEELAQITMLSEARGIDDRVNKALEKSAPGWTVSQCGREMEPGLRENYEGRGNVVVTHPWSEEKPCILSRTVEIPDGKKTWLKLEVGHHPEGDWELIVKANGEELRRSTIGVVGWIGINVDLSQFAGQKIKLELLNQANGWSYEAGYWSKIELESK